VSFVYVHTSPPFARKGDLQMQLPRMDIAVNLVEWEVFVPERYSVRQRGGNVIGDVAIRRRPARQLSASPQPPPTCHPAGRTASGAANASLTGQVRDASGGLLPGVTVETYSRALIERVRTTVTDSNGRYRIATLPPGDYCMLFTLPGFETVRRDSVRVAAGATVDVPTNMRVGRLDPSVAVVAERALVMDAANAQEVTMSLSGRLGESETGGAVINLTPGQVRGICSGGVGVFCNPNAPVFNAQTSTEATGANQGRIMVDGVFAGAEVADLPTQRNVPAAAQQSQNVVNLQRRVAGVLPVRVDVPRAGTSHWFMKPLVIDQEVAVTLAYKRR
jgi:hypothetical protein